MSIFNKENKVWQIEEMETITVDKQGKETGNWNGYAVSKILDPVNYCFLCRDKDAAADLCNYLNNECIEIDDSIDAFVMDNLIEWSNRVTELTNKEKGLYKLKKEYQVKSDKLLADAKTHKEETDEDIIKAAYGGNNDKTRKQFVKDSLVKEAAEIKELEFRIDYLKRRISFLKQLIRTKTVIMEVKE